MDGLKDKDPATAGPRYSALNSCVFMLAEGDITVADPSVTSSFVKLLLCSSLAITLLVQQILMVLTDPIKIFSLDWRMPLLL